MWLLFFVLVWTLVLLTTPYYCDSNIIHKSNEQISQECRKNINIILQLQLHYLS